MMNVHSGRRKALTFQEKLNIIQRVDENTTMKHVCLAKEFGIPASTLSNILSKRNELVSDAKYVANMCKRKRVGKYEDVEHRLLMWYKDMQNLHVPVNGIMLRSMAQQIASQLNVKFAGSNGWIDRFKKRTGIKYDTKGANKYILQKDDSTNCNKKREFEPKLYKPSFIGNLNHSQPYNSPPTQQQTSSNSNLAQSKHCIIIKEENNDDDIELIEEEDTLHTDEDFSNTSAYHLEQTVEESPSTSNLDSGFDESHTQERDRFRRIFSPGMNPEVTLVPKKDMLKRRNEEMSDSDDYIEEKKKKNEEYKPVQREESDDRITIFGKFVMSQMRTVTDKVLLIKLEHSIQNAIIDAQLKQMELEEKKNKEGSM